MMIKFHRMKLKDILARRQHLGYYKYDEKWGYGWGFNSLFFGFRIEYKRRQLYD